MALYMFQFYTTHHTHICTLHTLEGLQEYRAPRREMVKQQLPLCSLRSEKHLVNKKIRLFHTNRDQETSKGPQEEKIFQRRSIEDIRERNGGRNDGAARIKWSGGGRVEEEKWGGRTNTTSLLNKSYGNPLVQRLLKIHKHMHIEFK